MYKYILAALLASTLLPTAALAQNTQPLPANYQTILNNPDVLVMRVHYGPHEFVPMHDHSDYPTIFVYLNNSGPVRIDHAPPTNLSVTRPPTHTGAFRIAPGMHERHSITNLSDLPSDFLRVELKSIPSHAIKEVFRGNAPTTPITPGLTTLYSNPYLKIERILCSANCFVDPSSHRSLLIAITAATVDREKLAAGQVRFFPAWRGDKPYLPPLSSGGQFLRVSFLYPE